MTLDQIAGAIKVLSDVLRKMVGDLGSLGAEVNHNRKKVDQDLSEFRVIVTDAYKDLCGEFIDLRERFGTIQTENETLRRQIVSLERYAADHEDTLIAAGKPPCPTVVEDLELDELEVRDGIKGDEAGECSPEIDPNVLVQQIIMQSRTQKSDARL